jgi:hypothetical protein
MYFFLFEKNLLAELNYSRRLFNLNPIEKLKRYTYWFNELDKRLINEDLSKLEIEYIYLVSKLKHEAKIRY